MLRRWMFILGIGSLMMLVTVAGYAARNGEVDADKMRKQAEANAHKFPPAIAALVQPGVTVGANSYGADPLNHSFVMIEFHGEKPIKAYAGFISRIHDVTVYHFKLTAYDRNTDVGKFTLQQMEQFGSREEEYKIARQEMKELASDGSDPSPVVETKTGYGIALSRRSHFPSRPDGCSKTVEQTYYSCRYLGRVKDIIFDYRVDAIAIDKSEVDQWFQSMIAKMKTISVKQLL